MGGLLVSGESMDATEFPRDRFSKGSPPPTPSPPDPGVGGPGRAASIDEILLFLWAPFPEADLCLESRSWREHAW